LGRVQGACALITRDGRLLLARRSPTKRFFPSCWDLIGGHVEAGETPAEALVREIREEVGVTPTRFAPLAPLTVTAPGTPGATYHLFHVTDWTDGGPRLLGDEHTDLRWFTVEEACALDDLALDEYRALFRRVV
jgi:mutator protein MutT